MRLKSHSIQIKKNIAVLLHLIFLSLGVGGISVMYLNSQIGSGISWLRQKNYEDSPQFVSQFEEDLDSIFDYVAYRDVFEEDGGLDLSSQMFSVTKGEGPEIIYTLDEVLRYARSQGFYLNSDFEVINDLLIYDNAATSKDYRINWRAYMIDWEPDEPGDAYTSLLELSREVLDCLGSYYKVHYRMIVNPSNLYFQILYYDDQTEAIVYTNAEGRTAEELKGIGSYCYLDNELILPESNLPGDLQNIATFMEKNNYNDLENYSFIAAVDTSYVADDIYADNAKAYKHLRDRFLEGLLGLILGIIGCLFTLYYLILKSGYRSDEQAAPSLCEIDQVQTESFIALAGVLTLFALFLAENVSGRLLHLLLPISSWNYAERMMRVLVIYGCVMVGAFSLLRRYKCGQLWENSLLHHIQLTIDQYFIHHSFSHRLFCLYISFLSFQLIGFGGGMAALHFRRYSGAKVAALVIGVMLVVIDCRVFHKLFVTSLQRDQITNAIVRIAEGDTSYQMELEGLSGKELEIARMLNRIGTGLEQALQEQVKSERLKADLITNVSHDIKTPLTSIINYVDLIKREHIQNERIQEYLKVLEQKSQRLKTLTEDLLEASKASSGTVKLEMAKLDLVEMIWQTNGEFEEKFAERHLDLVSTFPERGVMIEADGRHLWRVLENLYNNAFKYAMEHSRVFTDICCENGWAYFTIKNVSVNPLNVGTEDLVERFVRGDVSRTTEGSGLGLSIAQSLTKLQGGTFEILVDGDLFKARIGFAII